MFPDSFKMNVTEVNRAGSGSSALWDCSGCSGGPQQSTSISATEAYTCPANLLAPYTSFSGTANCIQVKVSSPPCQQNPNTSYTFSDGNTETQEFPCTTPGFGTANANWSKLQDMQPGDWLLTNAGSQGENLVLLSVTYNSATNIDLWLLRWAAHNYLAPLFPGKDDLSGSAHASPWLLYMGPTYATNAAALDASSRNQYLDQEQSAALLFAWVIRSRGDLGRCGFVFLSASLVWRKLYRHGRHLGSESIVESSASRRLPPGRRLRGATTGRATH